MFFLFKNDGPNIIQSSPLLCLGWDQDHQINQTLDSSVPVVWKCDKYSIILPVNVKEHVTWVVKADGEKNLTYYTFCQGVVERCRHIIAFLHLCHTNIFLLLLIFIFGRDIRNMLTTIKYFRQKKGQKSCSLTMALQLLHWLLLLCISVFESLIMFLEFKCFLLPGFCFMPGAQQRIFKLTKTWEATDITNLITFIIKTHTHWMIQWPHTFIL